MFSINLFDIIYFLSALFMIIVLFAGVDQSFAVVVGFSILALWFKLKNIVE